MKIEILYVPGCPNYRPAVERVQKVLITRGEATISYRPSFPRSERHGWDRS
jgi:hypothetical protein